MSVSTVLKKAAVHAVRGALAIFIRAYFKWRGAALGTHLRALSWPAIRRAEGSSITVGNDCAIHNSSRLNVAGIVHRTSLATIAPGASISIGDRVGLSGTIIVAMSQVVIEPDVMLGVNVRIYDNDFHPIDLASRLRDDKDAIARRPIRICEGAWIGAGATVLKGVTIGAGAIVGAGSVVTRSIPAGTIYAGNPARFIRNVD